METTSGKMLDELLADDSDRLSAWEREWIDSLDKQRSCFFAPGFTPGQEGLLSCLWRKILN